MAVKPKKLEDGKKKVCTAALDEAGLDPKPKPPKKQDPKSVTRVGPEDDCSYEEMLRQENDNADARPKGGDVSE